jgi:hypothetical protein
MEKVICSGRPMTLAAQPGEWADYRNRSAHYASAAMNLWRRSAVPEAARRRPDDRGGTEDAPP